MLREPKIFQAVWRAGVCYNSAEQRLCFPEAQATIKRHVTEAVAVLLNQNEAVCLEVMPLVE